MSTLDKLLEDYKPKEVSDFTITTIKNKFRDELAGYEYCKIDNVIDRDTLVYYNPYGDSLSKPLVYKSKLNQHRDFDIKSDYIVFKRSGNNVKVNVKNYIFFRLRKIVLKF